MKCLICGIKLNYNEQIKIDCRDLIITCLQYKCRQYKRVYLTDDELKEIRIKIKFKTEIINDTI